MCSFFLWKGSLEGHHSAKVSWGTITLTKEQGGLGIKDLATWNKACSMRLLWLLFFREDSVWASWFKEVILKGDLHNYWTIKPNQSNSWLVNKLIKARPLVLPLIKLRLENGQTARFWSHNWAPEGYISALSTASHSRLGIPQTATVASLCRNGNWCLPPARSDAMLNLYAHLTTIQLSDAPDYYEWEIQGKVSTKFTTGDVYSYLRGEIQMQSWTKTVWFPHAIPRHSFNAWLMFLNRSPTRDRMMSWGLQVDPMCLLCNAAHESRNHLYFESSFSFDLWCIVARRCRIPPHRSWNLTVAQMNTLPTEKSTRTLALLAWQASLYWLWNERNSRLHSGIFRSTDVLCKLLDQQIRNKTQSFRDTNPSLSSKMLQRWFAYS